MCASLQSGVRLHFAPRLQEAFALKCTPRFYQHWLGIRCLRRFNSALLAKWLWRYGLENDALWRRVIGVKYGNEWDGWCTKSVFGAFGVGLWKFIRSGWLKFSKFLRYDVGDGTRVKSWDDVWFRDRPLKEAFTDLYNISRTRDASVFEVMCYANGRISWDI